MPRQDDFQVDRMRGVMNKERGTKAILSLCALLAVALLLWQGTTTTRAQGANATADEGAGGNALI